MYLDYLNGHTDYLRKYIWKIKVPLKIRIFMWFLHRKVILTKDNLIKRNWQGNTKCSFCDHDETIQHLFFECPFAKIIWRIVHMAFGIPPHKNVSNLFGGWLHGVHKIAKNQIRVGIYALLWAMWHVRNYLIFKKSNCASFLQVIPLATHWIRTWLCLQPKVQRQDMDFGCSRLETAAQDLFSRCGWQLDRRLTC
jgi:hypothetical protein